MDKSEFAKWMEEVEKFLGHKLTDPEWTQYMNMYWDIACSPDGAKSTK